ncbi:MAG: hypothetical protein ABI697_02195 [Devosia sp.]
MRSLLAAVCAVVLLLGGFTSARAADYADRAALDRLFADLHSAPTAAAAADLTEQIWRLWFAPPKAELATQMARAGVEISVGDLPSALASLNAIIQDYPDYAEGWNQRATVEYLLGQLDASLADIAQTLALEPRHFGALSGRVMIYLQQGRRDEARQDMLAALAINPYMKGRELFPELEVTHL